MWDNAHEKEMGKEDGAEICHKWRVDAECDRVQDLGCVINEHVESKVLVDSRGRAGARALCAWLRRCMQGSCWRGARGVINFVKLLEAMVESVLLYRAGICMGMLNRYKGSGEKMC